MAKAVPLTVDGFEADARDRWVIYSALLAQTDDIHAGGVYNWTAEDFELASRIIAELSGSPLCEVPEGYGKSLSSKVIIQSILVPVYDLDHPELGQEEWDEAERLVSSLAEEFGR